MSAPDPLDEASAQLFASLRDESPPPGAEQRALLAARNARDERPPAFWRNERVIWGGFAAAATLAAGLSLRLLPASPSESISAEPASSFRRPRVELPASNAVETPPPPVSASPLAPVAPRPVVPPAPSHAPPATLSDELAALRTASTALNAGDAAGALAALERYERVLKGTQLRAEATLLEIQARSQSGQTEVASNLAEQFVKQNPDSPLVDRARSYVRQK